MTTSLNQEYSGDHTVFTMILPYYVKDLGITIQDMINLALSTKSLSESELVSHINKRIDTSICTMSLGFDMIGPNEINLAMGVLRINSRRYSENLRFGHTVCITVDPKKDRNTTFRPRKWIKIQRKLLKEDRKDKDLWNILWHPMIQEALKARGDQTPLSPHCKLDNISPAYCSSIITINFGKKDLISYEPPQIYTYGMKQVNNDDFYMGLATDFRKDHKKIMKAEKEGDTESKIDSYSYSHCEYE